MKDYREKAEQLIKYLGGAANITTQILGIAAENHSGVADALDGHRKHWPDER